MVLAFFYAGGVLAAGTDLPKVYITCKSARESKTTFRLGDGWKKAEISIKGAGFNLSETDIQIKERGNSTKGTGKTPFSIKFKKPVCVCGMKKNERWVLLANYFDRSLIRTEFASYIENKIFNSTWNASFVPVNLYFNGKFIGTYDIGENNRIGKNRINIQSLKAFADKNPDFKDVNKDKKVDINDSGFLLEIDTFNETAERLYFYSNQYLIPFTLKDPDFSSKEKYPWTDAKIYRDYARGKINTFETMLVKKDFGSNYKNYIDVDSFVDWYLINEFSKNSDAIFQKSVCVYYNGADGKIYMGPNWDFDLAFGNLTEADCDNPKGFYIYGGKKWCKENQYLSDKKGDGNGFYTKAYWINRLFELPEFKAAVKSRWNSQKNKLKTAIKHKIKAYAKRVSGSIAENEKNLPRLGVYEWNGPKGYKSRTKYEDEVDYMYLWCMERYNWMDEKISSW